MKFVIDDEFKATILLWLMDLCMKEGTLMLYVVTHVYVFIKTTTLVLQCYFEMGLGFTLDPKPMQKFYGAFDGLVPRMNLK